MDPHPGFSNGSFADRSWQLPGGETVRRILPGDLEELRRWRNTQQEVLRQQEPLTADHQKQWFEQRVDPSYALARPPEILVVVAAADGPVSYGGLTNIEWVSHRAELSFLTATERAEEPAVYDCDFARFLSWVKSFAFGELGLHRVFAETWAARTRHIELLEEAGFVLEGRLRQHIVKGGVLQDALIHGMLADDLGVQ